MDARTLLHVPVPAEPLRLITIVGLVDAVDLVDGRLVLSFKAGSVKRVVLGTIPGKSRRRSPLEDVIAKLGAETDTWPGQVIALEV